MMSGKRATMYRDSIIRIYGVKRNYTQKQDTRLFYESFGIIVHNLTNTNEASIEFYEEWFSV